jgi:hypothetical protein
MRKHLFVFVLVGVLGVLVLSSCVPGPQQTGGAAASTISVPTLPVQVAESTSTSVPLPTAEVSTSLPPSTSLPLTATVSAEATVPVAESTPGEGRRITLDDNGKTITLKVGERVLLFLGEGYTWDLNIDDLNVLGRVMGVMTIRGSQGLFEGKQAGATALTASGDPECRQSQPPCEMPSRIFEVQVVVQPAS